MSEPQSASTPKRVDVIASLPMEARLRSTCPYAGFRFPGDNQASLETQQLDQVNALDTLSAHHENVRKLLKAEKPTGIPHLFVLDPESLAIGDLDAQTTLHALANTQFSDASQAAVAMLPPDTGFSPAAKMAATLVKDTVLEDSGIVTLESVVALEEWLAAFNTPSA